MVVEGQQGKQQEQGEQGCVVDQQDVVYWLFDEGVGGVDVYCLVGFWQCLVLVELGVLLQVQGFWVLYWVGDVGVDFVVFCCVQWLIGMEVLIFVGGEDYYVVVVYYQQLFWGIVLELFDVFEIDFYYQYVDDL